MNRPTEASKVGSMALHASGGNGARQAGPVAAERIAVIRALPGLGDFLCAVPAWRALRAAFPRARIALVGLPTARELVIRFGRYLDDYLPFPGFPGINDAPLQVHEFPAFLARVQARPFDLVVQMHGNGSTSNAFAMLLAGRTTAGFYVPGNYCPDPARFLAYPEDVPEVWRHLRLLEFLGIPLQGSALEFPIESADEAELEDLMQRHHLRPGGYVCVHPGASQLERRWPAAQFAAVADGLCRLGFQVVLTGTAGESALTAAVASQMEQTPVDLAGETSLGAVAALLRGARLLVANDTGVSHLAAAVRAPSLVLFIASDPARWAPLDNERHLVRDGRAGGLAAGDVLADATALLARTAPEAIYA